MGLGAGDVLCIEVAVEIDRSIDRFEDRVGLLPEHAAPHPLVHHVHPRRNCSPMTAPTPETPIGPAGKPRLGRLLLAAALLGAAVGFAAVYGMGGLKRN